MEEKEYVPYGPEWEAQMMKMSKKELVNSIRVICQKNKDLEKALQAIQSTRP